MKISFYHQNYLQRHRLIVKPKPCCKVNCEDCEFDRKVTTSEKNQLENSADAYKENSCELSATGRNDENNLVEDGITLTRSKRTFFHKFQYLHLVKLCPLEIIMMRLMIKATFLFVQEYYDNFKNDLLGTKKISVPLIEYFTTI